MVGWKCLSCPLITFVKLLALHLIVLYMQRQTIDNLEDNQGLANIESENRNKPSNARNPSFASGGLMPFYLENCGTTLALC